MHGHATETVTHWMHWATSKRVGTTLQAFQDRIADKPSCRMLHSDTLRAAEAVSQAAGSHADNRPHAYS